jgi:hypothetical protein
MTKRVAFFRPHSELTPYCDRSIKTMRKTTHSSIKMLEKNYGISFIKFALFQHGKIDFGW